MPQQFTTEDELRDFLRANGIPVEAYGVSKAKTVALLFNEVSSGECALAVEDGRVIRSIAVICLDVLSAGMVLIEEKQIFPDGRPRPRTLDASAGEKMKPGETKEVAAERCLREEFPFAIGRPVTFVRSWDIEEESASYPGLTTRYSKHLCSVEMPLDAFPALLVIEDGLQSHYRWQPT